MRRTVEVRAYVALVALVGGFGCAAGDQGYMDATVRDSAGISIVENSRPLWDADAGWKIVDEPVVRVGLLDGPQEYQLYRAGSAVRLSDDRIVVANGGTNEIRFYDSDGRHLHSVGRAGEGPGEFRDLQRVWALPGDSLLAYDFMPAILSVFGPGGEFVRSLRVLSPEGRQVLVRGPAEGGSLIAEGAPIWGASGATTGVVRDSVPYYRYDATGQLVGIIGRFPSDEVYREITPEGVRMSNIPFPRRPKSAVAGGRFYFGPAASYELQVYRTAGQLERIIRLPQVRRQVTGEDIAGFRRRQLELAEREGTRQEMERRLDQMSYPETMPPYSRLIVDAESNIWVADYQVSEREGQTWRIFSPEGSYLGVVRVPDRLEVLQIGADFVLGRSSDEFDVEYIQVHTLIKN